jgi:hypothetical protein
MSRRALGSVDLLGLNSLGQNPGMNPIIGAAIGGGVSFVSTVALRRTSHAGRAEALGLLAGLGAAGAMYAMRSTRHAAIGAAVGAVLSTGLAWLEKTFLGAATVAVPGTAGMGIPALRNLNGLGIPMARNLNGMGYPMSSNTPVPAGTIPGVAGNQFNGAPGLSAPPVSLLGPMSPQASHLRGIGGPSVHGLAASYGATLLGGGRG